MEEHTDVLAQERAVRAVSRALLRAEQNRDLGATMTFFTEETILRPPGAPQVEGLQALRGFLVQLFSTSMGEFDSAPTRIVLSAGGDLACDTGWFRMPSEEPDGPAIDEGKYTIVWRKAGGEWAYLVGSFNYDAPDDKPRRGGHYPSAEKGK